MHALIASTQSVIPSVALPPLCILETYGVGSDSYNMWASASLAPATIPRVNTKLRLALGLMADMSSEMSNGCSCNINNFSRASARNILPLAPWPFVYGLALPHIICQPQPIWTMTTRPSNDQCFNKAGNGKPHAGRQNSRPDYQSPQTVSQSLQTAHTGASISMQPSSRSAQMKDNAGPGQPLVLGTPA